MIESIQNIFEQVTLFDYIHSLDSLKLAEKISVEQEKKKFKPQIFVQVNIGNEEQKNGVLVEDLEEFLNSCKQNYDLNIIGLMCLPPVDTDPTIYFDKMEKALNDLSLNELSMGMSSDYLTAIEYSASYLRIGSSIFGSSD